MIVHSEEEALTEVRKKYPTAEFRDTAGFTWLFFVGDKQVAEAHYTRSSGGNPWSLTIYDSPAS